MSTMTLIELADELQAIIDGERPRLNKTEMRDYMAVLRAPPAQTVDVGAIREVITEMEENSDPTFDTRDKWMCRLTRAVSGENAAPSIRITPEMVREAEAHIPFAVNRASATGRWEWFASYYNQALAEPHKPCPCCGVTPSGELSFDPEPDAPVGQSRIK